MTMGFTELFFSDNVCGSAGRALHGMRGALDPLPSAIETWCGDARGVCLIPAL